MEQTQHIFELKDLWCEYIPGQPVLKVPSLNIPSGKLIFIIGKSGIGKSTFIETLGLMNKTIANRSETIMQFLPKGTAPMELKGSWGLSNAALSDLRRKHFSFIFQNTNLMPNFSCGENMLMSLLIEGQPYEKAKAEVLAMMDRLSLDRSVFEKRITEISGGQRQRLAFVRAITADFSVLFGDEPTGNLDQGTAQELLKILSEYVQNKGKTCIIVSHDLKLALGFADLILPITAQWIDEENSQGLIEAEKMIQRQGDTWSNADGQVLEDPHHYLESFLAALPYKNTLEQES